MSDKKLELIHVIFRHGQRTPDEMTFYKKENESNCNEYYPYGVGQLTNKGKKDVYELGKDLRQHYDEFLGEIFLPKYVDAWTSEFERTQASLMAFFAGLYPPKKELIWNDSLLWQPIPLKYKPVQDDMVFLPVVSLEYRQAYNENFKKSSIGQKILKDYKDVISHVQEHTGLEMYDTYQILKVYDCLVKEKIFNVHPKWATDDVFSGLRKIVEHEFGVMMTETTELKRMFCGPIFEKILHDCKQKIQGKSTRKIHIYSGHDINVVAILTIFEVMTLHRPKQGSCVVVELYSTNQGYEIEIKYKSSATGSFDTLLLPGGRPTWSFKKMEEQLKKYGPKTSTIVPETKIVDRIFTK